MPRLKVQHYIKKLLQNGELTFTNDDLVKNTDLSPMALNKILWRLKQQNQIMTPVRTFHVIIPIEAQQKGVVAPEYYINDLFRFLKRPYYVGLLSAASYLGASHQAVQVFQVITDASRKEISFRGTRVQFVRKQTLQETKTFKHKTDQGYLPISTAEETALDLMRYQFHAGGINFASTVLFELSENMKADALAHCLKKEDQQAHVRRLGYILESICKKKKLSKVCFDHLDQQKKEAAYSRLVPGQHIRGAVRNDRWKLWVNETIEIDDL